MSDEEAAAAAHAAGQGSVLLSQLASAIHVWILRPRNPRQEATELAGILSSDERERAGRFHFERDRDSFIVIRGRLRTLLSGYHGCRPQELEFGYGPQGKPWLLFPAYEGFEFNLSHSGGLAVVAISLNRELGIDVEQVRPVPDALEIARQQFARAEYADLLSFAGEAQTAAFYRCWTAKEAFLKGLGTGLERDLGAFRVDFRREENSALLSCEWDQQLCRTWQLQPIEVKPFYTAALAYRGIVPLPAHMIQVRNLAE